MTHESGFVQALLDDDDQAARLIFADWLDERDDPRGEFLRVQAELAAWVPDYRRRALLQQRQRDWLRRHGPARLLGPLLDHCSAWAYENGTGRVTLEAQRFLSRTFAARAADVLRAAWVRTVRLEGVRGRLGDVAAAPALDGVTALDLSGQGLTDTELPRLLESPYLGGLRELDLSGNRLTDMALRMIAAAPVAARLTRLNLRNNNLYGHALDLLRDGRPLLELAGNPFTVAPSPPVGGRPPRFLTVSLGIELALVPAGSFLMGSPGEPRREPDDE